MYQFNFDNFLNLVSFHILSRSTLNFLTHISPQGAGPP